MHSHMLASIRTIEKLSDTCWEGTEFFRLTNSIKSCDIKITLDKLTKFSETNGAYCLLKERILQIEVLNLVIRNKNESCTDVNWKSTFFPVYFIICCWNKRLMTCAERQHILHYISTASWSFRVFRELSR